MLVCRACTRRASVNLLRRLPAAGRRRLTTTSRTFATSSVSRQSPDSDYQNLSSDWGELEAVAQEEEENKSVNNGDKGAKWQKVLEKLRRAAKKELQYTTDPYHIAESVVKKLEENLFEKALMLTQEASKNKQVVVSWNHLIEYEFKNQKLHAAIKLYNEMKKRAQLPNAQTYTIIFKGCAESKHSSLAVAEAFKIYSSMLASSRLKPNQIHLNAMLELCARAQDIETLFTVLRSANGQRTPNSVTYTIILNALRYQRSNWTRPNPNEDENVQKAAVAASMATTISRSKLVWDEVMTRWKKGEIVLDEELTCAMGRVLLLGGPSETDSILALLSEVLGITKLLDGQPGFINPAAQEAAQAKTSENAKQPQKRQKPQRIETAEQFEESDKGEDFASTQPKDQDHARPPPSPNGPAGLVNTNRIAGNNTLSLVMRALAQARRTKLSARYWDYLIQTHNIVPDRRNYRDYIDCLSTGNASGKAARVLVSMPSTIADPNLYRRGILLCIWDDYNEKAFENATLIHNAMVKKLRVPDPRCMKLYLQVAVSNYRKFEDKEKFPDEMDGRKAHAMQISTALDHVWEPMRRVTADLGYSKVATSSATAKEAWQRLHPERENIIDVARNFIRASDKILSQELIKRGDQAWRPIVDRRRIMQAFVNTWAERNERYAGRGKHGQRVGEIERDEKDFFAAADTNS